jgi:hypothetical protein
MRNLLLILGLLALAIGLLWVGQGTGAIKWPHASHDRPDPVGRIWHGAGSSWFGPDLAGQALEHDPEKCETGFQKDHA